MMRLAGVLGVLLFAATPVMAGPLLYTFDVTTGSVVLSLEGVGSVTSGMAGTFAMTINQSDCHVGESDTFVMEGTSMSNTDEMVLSIAGIATANVGVGSARILDFMQPDPTHIGPGGVGIANSDAFLEATVVVSGTLSTTFITATSAGQLLPLVMTFNTSVGRGGTLVGLLDFTFGYEIGIPDIGMTITLDLIMAIEGTAQVAPDPALGGFTALGLGGAGAWLRRRRI